MPQQLGRFTLHEVRDGFFRLDGGAMFGVVPRVLWERTNPPDEKNRIRLALRCLLIDTGQRKILVDDGIGGKLSPSMRERFAVERDEVNLDTELARAGLEREDVTDVVLTHLHFDHAGGTTREGPGGELELAFPKATFHLQRRQLRWAHHASERDGASFLRADFEVLERSGRLHLMEGETELVEGVQLCVSEGHTVGMQLVRVESGGAKLIFCGDLIPTSSHLRPAWQMGFDLYPLTVLEEKKLLLAQALEDDSIIFFEHDPVVAACRLREEEGEVVAGEPLLF